MICIGLGCVKLVPIIAHTVHVFNAGSEGKGSMSVDIKPNLDLEASRQDTDGTCVLIYMPELAYIPGRDSSLLLV